MPKGFPRMLIMKKSIFERLILVFKISLRGSTSFGIDGFYGPELCISANASWMSFLEFSWMLITRKVVYSSLLFRHNQLFVSEILQI